MKAILAGPGGMDASVKSTISLYAACSEINVLPGMKE